MHMKVELKEKWVAALRSREFKQCQGALKKITNVANNNISYCCLGVLHEVSGGNWHHNKYEPEYMFSTGVRRGAASSDSFLEGKFKHGLDEATQKTLATMNDEGKKFYEIAKWIEKNIPTK